MLGTKPRKWLSQLSTKAESYTDKPVRAVKTFQMRQLLESKT